MPIGYTYRLAKHTYAPSQVPPRNLWERPDTLEKVLFSRPDIEPSNLLKALFERGEISLFNEKSALVVFGYPDDAVGIICEQTDEIERYENAPRPER